MQERHQNKRQYFEEQARTTEKFVIPFIESVRPLRTGMRVLEIGCGEAGNLMPFLERGCQCVGVDLSPHRIQLAESFFSGHPNRDRLELYAEDIYEARSLLAEPFDLILMRDVIEHIPDQKRFMGYVKAFLKPDGLFFLGFPPWQMPFGGHQQICAHPLLAKLPYYHLLPSPVYRRILQWGGEPDLRIQELLEIKATGISMERFKRIVEGEGYRVLKEQAYLIQPNYETKFGLKPRKQSAVVAALPGIRNFLTSALYILLAPGS